MVRASAPFVFEHFEKGASLLTETARGLLTLLHEQLLELCQVVAD